MKINENQSLIDKVEINHIAIERFENFDSLVEKGIIEVNTVGTKHKSLDGKEFTRLSISDSKINKLVAGAKKLKVGTINFCNMQISVLNEGFGNLICYDVESFRKRLDDIKQHLIDEYGIYISYEVAKIKSIEINRTFKTQYEFKDYNRIFNLIYANLPYYYRTETEVLQHKPDGKEVNTYYSTTKKTNKSKKYIELKTYNKTKSLESIVSLNDNYMRVEFKIVGAEKVKSCLGSNDICDLTDDMIDSYFRNEVNKLIAKPLDRWKINRKKWIIATIKEQKKDSAHWQTNLLRLLLDEEIKRKYPLLLDIEELREILKQSKVIKRVSETVKSLTKHCKFESVLVNRDDIKMAEILDKLTIKQVETSTEENDGKILENDVIVKSA